MPNLFAWKELNIPSTAEKARRAPLSVLDPWPNCNRVCQISLTMNRDRESRALCPLCQHKNHVRSRWTSSPENKTRPLPVMQSPGFSSPPCCNSHSLQMHLVQAGLLNSWMNLQECRERGNCHAWLPQPSLPFSLHPLEFWLDYDNLARSRNKHCIFWLF